MSNTTWAYALNLMASPINNSQCAHLYHIFLVSIKGSSSSSSIFTKILITVTFIIWRLTHSDSIFRLAPQMSNDSYLHVSTPQKEGQNNLMFQWSEANLHPVCSKALDLITSRKFKMKLRPSKPPNYKKIGQYQLPTPSFPLLR